MSVLAPRRSRTPRTPRTRKTPRLLVVLAWLFVGAAGAQPGSGNGTLGEEEHQELSGPEENLTREIDGVRPDRGTKLPPGGVVYFASRATKVDVTVAMQEDRCGASSCTTVFEVTPVPLVPGCIACVFAVPLPDAPGAPTVRLAGVRQQESYSYTLDGLADVTAPIVADAPAVTIERSTSYDISGQPLRDVVRLQVGVRPPDASDVTALIAYAGRPGEELQPWAAKLFTPGCHPCVLEVIDPPGAADGETCVQIVATDWAGNRGLAENPVCVIVPPPQNALPFFGCAQAPSRPVFALALLLLLWRNPRSMRRRSGCQKMQR